MVVLLIDVFPGPATIRNRGVGVVGNDRRSMRAQPLDVPRWAREISKDRGARFELGDLRDRDGSFDLLDALQVRPWHIKLRRDGRKRDERERRSESPLRQLREGVDGEKNESEADEDAQARIDTVDGGESKDEPLGRGN